MERVVVQSSNLKSIGWEDDVLEVEFVKGGLYRYTNVPEEIFKAIVNAPSKGKAFHRYIRSGKQYKYERLN